LPSPLIQNIASIYSCRAFKVRDAGNVSRARSQASGISQGCPLSPFLFVMTMTVLMHDAVGSLNDADTRAMQEGGLGQLVYADDTLLISVSAPRLERLLGAVREAGEAMGLELHMDKFQLLKVRCDGDVQRPDGAVIDAKSSFLYLGTTVSDDGKVGSELARRMGMAGADFRHLTQLWRHSSISVCRKVELFNAIIVSKFMYGLSSLWLNASERRRLDGFQNRLLRRIAGIQHSMFSRISNKEVF